MMIYSIKGQGQTALVEGPSGEEVNELWDEFMEAVRENIGDRPPAPCPQYDDRRQKYLGDCMQYLQGVRPEHVEEIDVFLALLVRHHGFAAVQSEAVLVMV